MSARPPLARTAVVAAAPVLLLLAFVYHPYIARLNNDTAVAAELTGDETRWGLSHLAVGVASGVLLLALLTVLTEVRGAGEHTFSTLATPFLVMGSTLFVLLPAMEIGALAAVEAGADAAAVLDHLNTWFMPVLVAASLTFAIGVVMLALGIRRSDLLSPRTSTVVVTALILMAAARFVPLGAALYVSGVAGVVALWPFAHRTWITVPAEPRQVSFM